jgi:hypothetical protein
MSLKETATPYDGGGEEVDEVLEKLEIYKPACGNLRVEGNEPICSANFLGIPLVVARGPFL